MSKDDNANYQTIADFARLVGVHRSTVLDWVRKGKLKSKKRTTAKNTIGLMNVCFTVGQLRNIKSLTPNTAIHGAK